MKKIALVGLAPSSHDAAPWTNEEWEIWGLPWDPGYWPCLDRAFEMHPLELLKNPEAGLPRDYIDRLRELDRPLYMQAAYADIPNALEYPLDEVAAVTGDYFGSSLAYMLAMAIWEGHEEIGIWGADMDIGTEWECQRPNMEYLVGFARGIGVNVTIHPASPLCKFVDRGIPLGTMKPGYSPRYGFING